jgi:uncharacterized protein YbjT (DUF2867 family)
MKILVTTPTGKIGSQVFRELLAPEFSVRVIVRDPSRLPEEIRGQVEVIRGSTDDAAALRRALVGVDALFWCVPGEPLEATDVRAHYERFARAGAQAIRQAGTRRVVTISAGGKGLARNAGPISGLHVMEDMLNESGAAIRHLRCGAFMENFLRQAQTIATHGVLSYPMAGYLAIPMVAVTDIADTALRWLVRRDWKGVAGVAVHGAEDLSHGQAAAVMERVLERRVRYHDASANRHVQSLIRCGASAEYARSQVEMYSELANGISRAEPRTAESTTVTTLAAWTERVLRPVVETIAPQPDMEMASARMCDAQTDGRP